MHELHWSLWVWECLLSLSHVCLLTVLWPWLSSYICDCKTLNVDLYTTLKFTYFGLSIKSLHLITILLNQMNKHFWDIYKYSKLVLNTRSSHLIKSPEGISPVLWAQPPSDSYYVGTKTSEYLPRVSCLQILIFLHPLCGVFHSSCID